MNVRTMGAWCDAMVKASTSVWHWFFPKKLDVPECVMELLKKIYPTVKWERVTFYEGLPNVISLPTWLNAINPNWAISQGAITLPDFNSLTGINVYFQPTQKDWCNCGADLNTYVHESMHVLQIQEWLDGWGIGIARSFVTDYMLTVLIEGYGNDVFEQQAVAVENVFLGCCGTPVCTCASGTPNDPNATTNTTALAALDTCTGLVQTSSGLKFWEIFYKHVNDWAAGLIKFFCKPLKKQQKQVDDANSGTPGVTVAGDMQPPENEPKEGSFDLTQLICWIGYVLAGLLYVLWTVLSFVLTLLAAIFFWIIEIIGLIISAVMWILTGIICALEWLWGILVAIWDWIVDVVTAVLDWIEDGIAKIHDWAAGVRKDCEKWENARECSEWEDQGYNECTETRDEGYNECTETRDEGYRDCCDWWPCSWLCDAWVWVSNIVCVAWTWVSNIVCVVWTWIENLVCVAWTWTVSTGCWLFTGAIMGLTGWANED